MIWYVIHGNILTLTGPSGTWYANLDAIADPDVERAVAWQAARITSPEHDVEQVLRIFRSAREHASQPMRSNP